jgi:hypothetical protein
MYSFEGMITTAKSKRRKSGSLNYLGGFKLSFCWKQLALTTQPKLQNPLVHFKKTRRKKYQRPYH